MKIQDFVKTGFFAGIKAKIDGEWREVVSADFEDFTVDVNGDEFIETHNHTDIEEFSRLKESEPEDKP